MRMKWVARSWLGLLAVGGGLTPIDRAYAQDTGTAGMGAIGLGGSGGAGPSEPAQVVSPRAPIPANGAILISSGDGSRPTVFVTDPLGAPVAGASTPLSTTEEAAFFAWNAMAELGLGMHRVELKHGHDPSLNATFEVEIVAAADRTIPTITSEPSVSSFMRATARACCTTPIQDVTDHCALSEQHMFARVDPGLSSMATVSELNQFLFTVRAENLALADITFSPFQPFGSSHAVDFESAADTYCIVVQALDIATFEMHTYPELARCVAAGSVHAGPAPTPLAPGFLADEACLQPPVGHKEEWCAANAANCADGVTERCKLYRYACEEGPLPNSWRAGAAAHPERDIPLRGPDLAAGERCSVLAPGSRGNSGMLVQLALLALIVCRGRRSWHALLGLFVVLASVAPARADDPVVARAPLIGNPLDRAPELPPRDPQVVSPGAPIPANGAILIESRDGLPVIAAVYDPTGARVEGTTTLVSEQEPAYYAWTPAGGELDVGRYWVELRNESGTALNSSVNVEIVAVVERTKPELTVSPSVSSFTAPSARACCLTLQQDGLDHCALTEQQTFAQVDPGFSSTATVGTLNQFLFRVRAAESSAEPAMAAVFLPFGADAALRFAAAADEYCVEVDALDIATMEEHRYPDLDYCVAGASVDLGTTPIELDDAFLAGVLCIRPPTGHEERWCEVNGDVCDAGLSQKCTQLQDSCVDRPSRDAGSESDAAAHDTDAEISDPQRPSSRSGDDCSCSAPGARGTRSHLMPSLLFALWTLGLYRRRSTLARHDSRQHIAWY
jgi:hypothetical protein